MDYDSNDLSIVASHIQRIEVEHELTVTVAGDRETLILIRDRVRTFIENGCRDPDVGYYQPCAPSGRSS